MDFCEFIAEDELIEIIPNFKYPKKINLISGDFGPFNPQMPVKVPIWMAVNLQKQSKCMIVIPTWVKRLLEATEEQELEQQLVELPHERWREIMKILEQYLELTPACADLIERREAMLKTSAHFLFKHAMDPETPFLVHDVEMNKVSAAEIQTVNVIVRRTFAVFCKLRRLVKETESL